MATTGIPAKSIESDWLDEVRRFLEDNKENHFKVYNHARRDFLQKTGTIESSA